MKEPDRQRITEAIICQACSYYPESGSDDKLRKCSACKWATYCNADCQRQHWPAHKEKCKKIASGRREGKSLDEILIALSALNSNTAGINITSSLPPPTRDTVPFERIYPLLAIAVNSAMTRGDWISQPMMQYQVDRIVRVPTSRQIAFSKRLPNLVGWNPGIWYPDAPANESFALARRLMSEGWTIEKSLGLTMALFRAFSEKNIGLTYLGDLIVDYGICTGRVSVSIDDRLSYKLPVCKLSAPAINASRPIRQHGSPSGNIRALSGWSFRSSRPSTSARTASGGRPDFERRRPCLTSKRYSVVKSPFLAAASAGHTPLRIHKSASEAINEICAAVRNGSGTSSGKAEMITITVSTVFQEAMLFFEAMLKHRAWTRYPEEPPSCTVTKAVE